MNEFHCSEVILERVSYKYGVFGHYLFQERVQAIMDSVRYSLNHFLSDSTISSIIVDNIHLRLKELIIDDFSLEVDDGCPSQFKTRLREHHFAVNYQDLVFQGYLRNLFRCFEFVKVKVNR